MPIPTDQVVITTDAMRDLRSIGLTDLKNMKLPPDLADKIHEARLDATSRKLNLPNGAVFDPSQVVNIEDLPEGHKAALKNYILQSQPALNAAAEVQRQVSVIVPNNPGVVPGLTKAMEVAAAASIPATPVQPVPAPVVNRPGILKAAPPQAPAYEVKLPVVPNNPPKVVVPTPAAWSQNMNTQVPATPPVQAPPPAAPPVVPMPTMEAAPYVINTQPDGSTVVTKEPTVGQSAEAMADTTQPVIERCPRCAFDLKKNKLVEEPTMNDLVEYRAQTIIGGHRYYKEYLTFSGALRVTFRTLTQKEEDCAVSQVVRDGANNMSKNDLLGDDYLRTQKRYRMIMSIDKIIRGDNVMQLATYSEYDPQKVVPDTDRLKTYYDLVVESVLTSSSLFNVIQEKFDNFDAYVAVMELRADDPKSYPTTLQQ